MSKIRELSIKSTMNRPMIVALVALTIGVAAALGCTRPDPTIANKAAIERTIGEQQFKLEGNTITQLTLDEDNVATYGVVSDSHGETEKARLVAQRFKERGVDGILVPGDIALNEQLRYGRQDSKDDKAEIVDILSVLAETRLPIYVIPGNHERKPVYEAALAEVTAKHDNVFDMTVYRRVNGDDADIISLPGYYTCKIPGFQFVPDDGYCIDDGQIKDLANLTKGLDGPVILLTHGAPKTPDGKVGPDTVINREGNGVENVGSELLGKIMQANNIKFAAVGNIDEASGLAARFDGESVMPEEYATQFTANFGSLEAFRHLNGSDFNGMVGVLTIKGNNAKYEMLVLN